MSEKFELHSSIWREEAQPENPFTADRCLAFGYDVYGDVLHKSSWAEYMLLLFTGSLVSVIFVSVAFLAAILSRDKAKGIGISILLWLYFALLFDGLVLFILFQFADYPIEKPMVLVAATNPLDLARILNLLQIDASAMMGYTGAIFRNYFGTGMGFAIAFLVLILWTVCPFWWSLRIFRKKDL